MDHASAIKLETLPLEPHALAYDPVTSALYVADASAGTISRVSNQRTEHHATVAGRLGGLAVARDGSMFVTRVGDRSGQVFSVSPDGSAHALAQLPTEFSRFGLTYDAREHVLYATQHLTSKFGAHEGSIIVIDLRSGVPSTLIDGFHQPIGIAKVGATLVIADARMRAVFRIERGVSRYQLAALTDRPGAICACNDDSVLVASYDAATQHGRVQRIWLDGRSRVVASGAWEPRGVATDDRRVFVAACGGDGILVFEL